MSDLVFPTLQALPTYPAVRSPHFHTGKQKAITSKESRIMYQQFVEWNWTFDVEYLSPTDLLALEGVFMAVGGDFDTFLYEDPKFNSVTAQQFAVTQAGDVAGTPYQVTAINQNIGGPGAAELIQNFNGVPSIYGNGTLIPSSHYSSVYLALGIISFNTGDQPASGTVLTWTGSFYYRVRFDMDDVMDFSEFMKNMYEIKKLKLRQIKL